MIRSLFYSFVIASIAITELLSTEDLVASVT